MDIEELENKLQSLGGIVTYQKDRHPTVTIDIFSLNALITKEITNELQKLPVSDFEGEDDLWFKYISIQDRDARINELNKD